jgi:hypothetical protein
MIPVLVGLLRAIRERAPAGSSAGDWLWETNPAQLRGWIGIEDAG